MEVISIKVFILMYSYINDILRAHLVTLPLLYNHSL